MEQGNIFSKFASDMRFAVPAIAIAGAYFAGPLLKYADARQLFLSGVGVAIAYAFIPAFAYYAFQTPARKQKRRGWVTLVLLVLAFIGNFFWLVTTLKSANRISLTNDQRCAAIQRMMLAPNPIRSDGPDLFQALGCRPQNLPFTEWPTKVRRATGTTKGAGADG